MICSLSAEVPKQWLSNFLEYTDAWFTNYWVKSLLCKQSGLLIIGVSLRILRIYVDFGAREQEDEGGM